MMGEAAGPRVGMNAGTEETFNSITRDKEYTFSRFVSAVSRLRAEARDPDFRVGFNFVITQQNYWEIRATLSGLAATLLDGPARRLPRAILRHFPGGTRQSSRAHTDFAYMDQGSDDLITTWVPVGDCSPQGGGLVYLDGSCDIEPDRLAALRTVTDRTSDGARVDTRWTRPWSADDGA